MGLAGFRRYYQGMSPSRRLLHAMAVLSIAGATAWAQAAPPAPAAAPRQVVGRGRIIGVYDEATGDPLDSVEVRDMLSGLSAFTTRTGTLSLFFVDTAGSMMRFRKAGYVPVMRTVANSLRDTIPLVVTLARAGQMLPVVVTKDTAPVYHSPALRAFEERRKEGHGYFVPEAQLRKEDDHKMSDVLLGHVPGVTFKRSATQMYLISGRTTVRLSRGAAGPCYPDVYLDGVRLGAQPDSQNPGFSGVDVNQLSVMDIGGIEYYNAASLPAKFNSTGAGCGALLLWSRER